MPSPTTERKDIVQAQVERNSDDDKQSDHEDNDDHGGNVAGIAIVVEGADSDHDEESSNDNDDHDGNAPGIAIVVEGADSDDEKSSKDDEDEFDGTENIVGKPIKVYDQESDKNDDDSDNELEKINNSESEKPAIVEVRHESQTEQDKINTQSQPTLGLSTQAKTEKNRRISHMPPARADDPSAVKFGAFSVVQRKESLMEQLNENQESQLSSEHKPSTEPKSDSKPTNEPNSKSKSSIEPSSEPKSSTLAVVENPKSRKFSQMSPASIDDPNAVKLGNKFTMIRRD